jgi:hypothetical protein
VSFVYIFVQFAKNLGHSQPRGTQTSPYQWFTRRGLTAHFQTSEGLSREVFVLSCRAPRIWLGSWMAAQWSWVLLKILIMEWAASQCASRGWVNMSKLFLEIHVLDDWKLLKVQDHEIRTVMVTHSDTLSQPCQAFMKKSSIRFIWKFYWSFLSDKVNSVCTSCKQARLDAGIGSDKRNLPSLPPNIRLQTSKWKLQEVKELASN